VNYSTETKQIASRYFECYEGGGIHFDGMALTHTCFVWILRDAHYITLELFRVAKVQEC